VTVDRAQPRGGTERLSGIGKDAAERLRAGLAVGEGSFSVVAIAIATSVARSRRLR
jgi:hypothetical protein